MTPGLYPSEAGDLTLITVALLVVAVLMFMLGSWLTRSIETRARLFVQLRDARATITRQRAEIEHAAREVLRVRGAADGAEAAHARAEALAEYAAMLRSGARQLAESWARRDHRFSHRGVCPTPAEELAGLLEQLAPPEPLDLGRVVQLRDRRGEQGTDSPEPRA